MKFSCRHIVLVLRAAFLLLLPLWFAACDEKTIIQDLNQKQSQEIVAVLAEQGIPAKLSKGTGTKGKYSISVPEKSYTEAISILHYEGLPSEQEPGLSQLLESKGFLPNSRELEAIRVERAIAAELEALIKANPSVQEAKAVVRRPNFSGVGPPPPTQLSVVVTKIAGTELDIEQLKSLISNLVVGVTDQSLVINVQEPRATVGEIRKGVLRDPGSGKIVALPMKNFLGWWRVANDDYDRMIFVISIVLAIFLIFGILLGFFFGFLGKKAVTSKISVPVVTLKSDRSTLTLGSSDE